MIPDSLIWLLIVFAIVIALRFLGGIIYLVTRPVRKEPNPPSLFPPSPNEVWNPPVKEPLIVLIRIANQATYHDGSIMLEISVTFDDGGMKIFNPVLQDQGAFSFMFNEDANERPKTNN